MSRVYLPLLLVVSVAWAGCAQSAAEQKAMAPPDSIVEAQPENLADAGTIVGNVVDDSIAPIASAQVGIVELALMATTDSAGNFEFRNVPSGAYTLNAIALGYESAIKRVEVTAGQNVATTMTLIPIAVLEPYYETLGPMVGYFECRLAQPPVGAAGTTVRGGSTGPCAPVSSGLEDLPSSMDFDIHNDTVAFVGEMKWTQGSFATSQRLRMSFSYTDRSSGHWWCTATSESPIQWKYTISEGGEGLCHAEEYCGIVNSKVPDGEKDEASIPNTDLKMLAYTNTPFACPDQGIYYELALQQRFEMAVTLFQSMMPPEGFSGFVDS